MRQIICSICNQPIDINKIKGHLFKSHLDFDFDLLIQTLINFKIKDYNENELRLLEKRWKCSKIKTDKTNIYLLKMKMFQFEQSIGMLKHGLNINKKEHQYYNLTSFIEELDEGIKENTLLKTEIKNGIKKINKIYTARLKKQDYYIKTAECIFCTDRFFLESINDHILKSHFREKSKTIESALMFYGQPLTIGQQRCLYDIKVREQEILDQIVYSNINSRYYPIEKEIKDLSGVEYAEMLESKVNSIKVLLSNYLNDIKYGELEIKKNKDLTKELQNFNASLPTKEKFINDYCKKNIYNLG